MDSKRLKKGMRMFQPGTSGKYLFVAKDNGFFDPPHADAFREAAEDLVNARLKAKGMHKDYLAWPIIYLYRHSMELHLKDLILLGIRYGEIQKSDALKKKLDGHKLIPLWNVAKKMILKVGSGADPEETDLMDTHVKDMDAIDHDGQNLRYLRNREGVRNDAFKGMHSIDLPNLLEVAGLALGYLWQWHAGIWAYHTEGLGEGV